MIIISLKNTAIVQGLCESRGGCPGLSVLTRLRVSMDLKQYWTMLRHWSQLVPVNRHPRTLSNTTEPSTQCKWRCSSTLLIKGTSLFRAGFAQHVEEANLKTSKDFLSKCPFDFEICILHTAISGRLAWLVAHKKKCPGSPMLHAWLWSWAQKLRAQVTQGTRWESIRPPVTLDHIFCTDASRILNWKWDQQSFLWQNSLISSYYFDVFYLWRKADILGQHVLPGRGKSVHTALLKRK